MTTTKFRFLFLVALLFRGFVGHAADVHSSPQGPLLVKEHSAHQESSILKLNHDTWLSILDWFEAEDVVTISIVNSELRKLIKSSLKLGLLKNLAVADSKIRKIADKYKAFFKDSIHVNIPEIQNEDIRQLANLFMQRRNDTQKLLESVSGPIYRDDEVVSRIDLTKTLKSHLPMLKSLTEQAHEKDPDCTSLCLETNAAELLSQELDLTLPPRIITCMTYCKAVLKNPPVVMIGTVTLMGLYVYGAYALAQNPPDTESLFENFMSQNFTNVEYRQGGNTQKWRISLPDFFKVCADSYYFPSNRPYYFPEGHTTGVDANISDWLKYLSSTCGNITNLISEQLIPKQLQETAGSLFYLTKNMSCAPIDESTLGCVRTWGDHYSIHSVIILGDGNAASHNPLRSWEIKNAFYHLLGLPTSFCFVWLMLIFQCCL